jgi:flagellar biosynthetic protein FliR
MEMIDIVGQLSIFDQIGNVWIVALLVFTRCMAFTAMAPPTTHHSIPVIVKVGFAILLTLLLFPNIEPPEVYPKNHEFLFFLFMNASVGLFIGWAAMLVIEIVRAAGEMINMQMALQAANLFDPGSQSPTTIIGRFFDYISLVVFLSVGGVEKTIEGLYRSFTIFPLTATTININIGKFSVNSDLFF